MVAVCRPLLPETIGKLVDVVDLVDSHTLIGLMQDLVVQMGVNVTLGAHDFLNAVITPARPGVRRKHHFCLLPVAVQRHVDLLRPLQRIAHQSAAQGIDVMNGAGDVLRSPECLQIGEPGVHLGGRFGAGCVLELHPDAIDGQLFKVLHDVPCRLDQAERPRGGVLPDGLVDMAKGAARQKDAVLEEHPAVHGIAGVDILGNRVFHEADRGNDRHLAAFHVRLVHHAAHPTEVVGMRM